MSTRGLLKRSKVCTFWYVAISTINYCYYSWNLRLGMIEMLGNSATCLLIYWFRVTTSNPMLEEIKLCVKNCLTVAIADDVAYLVVYWNIPVRNSSESPWRNLHKKEASIFFQHTCNHLGMVLGRKKSLDLQIEVLWTFSSPWIRAIRRGINSLSQRKQRMTFLKAMMRNT